MNDRSKKGATLAMVASVTIIIVVLGIAFFFLLKIFGGQRELQNSADAGTLNVAKQAAVEPWVSLSSTDPLQVAMLALDDPNGVDLFTYDRLVGQELLAAMNAAADGGPIALANASAMVQDIQALSLNLTSNNLNNPAADNNWASRFFNVANSNSVRMENQLADGSPSFSIRRRAPPGIPRTWIKAPPRM